MRAAVSVGHVSMYSNVDAGDAIGAPEAVGGGRLRNRRTYIYIDAKCWLSLM